MEKLHKLSRIHRNIKLYLPESFEWIILNAGLIEGNIGDISTTGKIYRKSGRFQLGEILHKAIESKDRRNHL